MNPSASSSSSSSSHPQLKATSHLPQQGHLPSSDNHTRHVVRFVEEIETDISNTMTLIQRQQDPTPIAQRITKIRELILDFQHQSHERTPENGRLLQHLITLCHLCDPFAKREGPMTKEQLIKKLAIIRKALEEERKRNEIEEVETKRQGKYIEYTQKRLTKEGDEDRLEWLDAISGFDQDLLSQDQITSVVTHLKLIHQSLSENQKYRLLGLLIPICELYLLPLNREDPLFEQKLHDILVIMHESVLTLIKFNTIDECNNDVNISEGKKHEVFSNSHSTRVSQYAKDFFQQAEIAHLQNIVKELETLKSHVFKVASGSGLSIHIRQIISHLRQMQHYEAGEAHHYQVLKDQTEVDQESLPILETDLAIQADLIKKLENLLDEKVQKSPDYLEHVQAVLIGIKVFLERFHNDHKVTFAGIDINSQNVNHVYYYATAHKMALTACPFFAIWLQDQEVERNEAEAASAATQNNSPSSKNVIDLRKLPGFAQLNFHNVSSIFDHLEHGRYPKIRELNEAVQLAIAADWIGESLLLERCEDKMLLALQELPDQNLENYVELLIDAQVKNILPRFHNALFARTCKFIQNNPSAQVTIISKCPGILTVITLSSADWANIEKNYFCKMWQAKYYRNLFTSKVDQFLTAQVNKLAEMTPVEICWFLTNLQNYTAVFCQQKLPLLNLYATLTPTLFQHLLDLIDQTRFTFDEQLIPLHLEEVTEDKHASSSSSSSAAAASQAAPNPADKKGKKKQKDQESDKPAASFDVEVPLFYLATNWQHLQTALKNGGADKIDPFLHKVAQFIHDMSKQIQAFETDQNYKDKQSKRAQQQEVKESLEKGLKCLTELEEAEKAIYVLEAEIPFASDPKPLQEKLDALKKTCADRLWELVALPSILPKPIGNVDNPIFFMQNIQEHRHTILKLKNSHPLANNITDNLKNLKSELEDLQQKLDALKKRRNAHPLETAEAMSGHSVLNEEIAGLEKQIKQKGEEVAELTVIKAKLEQLSREIIALENFYPHGLELLTTFELQLKLFASVSGQLAGLQKQIQAVETKKAAILKAIGEVRARMETARLHKKKISQKDEREINDHLAHLSEIEQDYEKLRSQMIEHSTEVASIMIAIKDIFTQALLATNKSISSLDAELAESESRIKRLKKRHDELVFYAKMIKLPSATLQVSAATTRPTASSSSSTAPKTTNSPYRQAAISNCVKLASLEIGWKNIGSNTDSAVFLNLNPLGEIITVASRITDYRLLVQNPFLVLVINRNGTFDIGNPGYIAKLNQPAQQLVTATVAQLNEYCQNIMDEIREVKRGVHPTMEPNQTQYNGIELNGLDIALAVFWGATSLELAIPALEAFADMYDNLAPVSRSARRNNASAAAALPPGGY